MTMHFLLTGQDPQAPDYQYLPIREWDPTLHEGLENIIERCVQQSPDDRFQTCDELLYALNHYEQESNAFRARQKKKLVTALATAGTGVLLLLCSLWILFQPLVIGTTAVIVWVGITLLLAGITAFSLALQLRNAHHCLHSDR